MPVTVLTWIQAALTIMLFSVVFADSPLYKVAEHLYVGLYAGYTVVVTWFNYIRPSSQDIIANQKYHLLIPICLGLLVYTRYISGWQWLARYNAAFVVGVGSGLILARDFKSLLLDQVTATFKPLWVAGKAGASLNNAVIVLGVVSVISHFLFTTKRQSVVGRLGSVGRAVMMIAFGSAFGNTVMSRVSLFLGRMQFLLGDWLKIVK
ncbi:MAG: hypothetical protein ACM3WU_04945 [Bacillota bacterium]